MPFGKNGGGKGQPELEPRKDEFDDRFAWVLMGLVLLCLVTTTLVVLAFAYWQ